MIRSELEISRGIEDNDHDTFVAMGDSNHISIMEVSTGLLAAGSLNSTIADADLGDILFLN